VHAASGSLAATPRAEKMPGFITAALPPGIYAVDGDGASILHFNDRFCEIWGLGHLKEKLRDGTLDNREIAIWIADRIHDTSILTLSDDTAVETLLLTDGRMVRRVTIPLMNEGGRPASVMYTFDDITHSQGDMEQALKASDRYRELADMLPQIVFEIDLEGRITFVNKSSFAATGYTQEDFVRGLHMTDMVLPEERQTALESLSKGAAGSRSGTEYTIVRKDGSSFPAKVYSSVIYRDGVPAGLRGIVMDIGEQKRAEDELRRTADEQKSIAEAALAISLCEDEDAVCRILGEQAYARNPGAFVAVSLYDRELDAIRPRHYAGIDASVERVISILHQDPRRLSYSAKSMSDADRAASTTGRLEQVTDGLYGLAMGKYPRAALIAVEKLLGIERVYRIGFGLNGLHYGSLIIILRKGQAIGGQYLLETLVRHASEVIRHRQAEQNLLENQRFQSILISNLPGMVYRCHNNPDWTMEYVSDGCRELTGYSPGDLFHSGKLPYDQLVHPGDRERIHDEIQQALNRDEPFKITYRIVTAAGQVRWVWEHGRKISASSDDEMLEGFIMDITERRQAEDHVRASLAEKEVLLKEIHHRVKNNLQVISSLLSLQASILMDTEVRLMLADSQHRIRSIALVHEKIYGSDDLANIDFTEYAQNLTSYLQRSYSDTAGRVRLTVEGDRFRLGANIAVPLGLILNELVSNCYKHAFRDGRSGTITVTLSRDPYRLIVDDNGVGLPAGFDFRECPSMGMQLVCTLVGQIEGEIEADSSRGTRFAVTYKPDS
ncbi:MAG TPA: PAS domain S-box protein, partial [Methanocella sp.]